MRMPRFGWPTLAVEASLAVLLRFGHWLRVAALLGIAPRRSRSSCSSEPRRGVVLVIHPLGRASLGAPGPRTRHEPDIREGHGCRHDLLWGPRRDRACGRRARRGRRGLGPLSSTPRTTSPATSSEMCSRGRSAWVSHRCRGRKSGDRLAEQVTHRDMSRYREGPMNVTVVPGSLTCRTDPEQRGC